MIQYSKGEESEFEVVEDWFRLLSCSIVEQAVQDYRTNMKLLENYESGCKFENLKQELKELVKFFNSKWFEDISSISRVTICTQLIKETKEFLLQERKHQEFLKEILREMSYE